MLLAVAVSAANWRIVDKNVATIDLGIAFLDPKVGYTAGTLNGAVWC